MACCSENFKPESSSHAAESIKEKGSTVENNSAKKEKPKDSARANVWTIGPPFWEKDTTWKQPKYLADTGKNFAEVCAMCKKDIGADKDVFMYGYLQAFCSDDCREDRIIFDRAFGPPSPTSKGTATNKSVVNSAGAVVAGGKAPTLNRSKRLYALGE